MNTEKKKTRLANFIAEVCIPGGRVDRKQLYAAYQIWARDAGTRMPLRQKAFAKRLRARKIKDGGKSGGIRYWEGISLSKETIDHFCAIDAPHFP